MNVFLVSYFEVYNNQLKLTPQPVLRFRAEITLSLIIAQNLAAFSVIQPKRALRPNQATVRFETPPGKQMQQDWGELKTYVNGQQTKVYFAVNSLGSSRRFHVWAGPKLDVE